ncbi:hypothetical protein ACFLX5_04815 [Chloroflexota bacterium]
MVLPEVTHGCASLDHHSASGSVQVLPGGAGVADIGTKRPSKMGAVILASICVTDFSATRCRSRAVVETA